MMTTPKIAEPVVDVNDVSHISSGTIIKGEVSSLTDIRIDGHVEGKVYSKGKIVVGDQAGVNGALLCTNLDFWGQMEGDIYVKDTLSLNGSCHMISEADYEKFVQDVVTTKIPDFNRSDKKPAKPAPAED